MPLIRHHSQRSQFRSPGGALPCGERVVLRLQVEAGSDVSDVRLFAWAGSKELVRSLEEKEQQGLWRNFETWVKMPGEPGVVWYYFKLNVNGKTIYYGNNHQQLGGMGSVWEYRPPSFQISVYDPAFYPPGWMRDGIMYQIFPDRFHDGHDGALLKKRPEIRVHENWYEPPDPVVSGLPGKEICKDFFGGNLLGIEQKLDYLVELGINVLYLNPIFKAHSNHKYDTGDYTQIDPTFGDNQAFESLCAAAKERGIRIVLDGVFSHTGEDSFYFNRYGNYPDLGAYQSKDSPYASWYSFDTFPDEYECWWGVPSLPEVQEMEPSYLDFIIHSPDAVIARWLRQGASGWRLDVADELPDEFIEMLRKRVKKENPDACIIGEVWEDATNKVAYGKPRTYALGRGLDSVMNYPLRDGLLTFLRGEEPAPLLRRRMLQQQENYPPPLYYSLMNLLSSHDRPRIINALAGCDSPQTDDPAAYRLSGEEYALGRAKFKLMLCVIAHMPGMPCLYYGDEAGMQGLWDPYCRGGYPWGREDQSLLSFCREILGERKASDAMRTGFMQIYAPHEDVLCILRLIRGGVDVMGNEAQDGLVVLAINRSHETRRVLLTLDHLDIPYLYDENHQEIPCPGGVLSMELKPLSMQRLTGEGDGG